MVLDLPPRPRMSSSPNSAVVATKRALAKTAVSLHSVNGRAKRANSPLKGPKHHGSLNLPTETPRDRAPFEHVPEAVAEIHTLHLVMVDAERDKAGEPEEHGQRVETKHGYGVRKGREESRRKGQVDEDEQRPDGDEDHEAVLRGSEAIGGNLGASAGLFAAETDGMIGREGWGKGRTVGGESEDYDGEESLDGA